MYQVKISKELFGKIRKETRFVAMINLGRYSNALMSILSNFDPFKEPQTNAERRNQLSYLWISAGLLYEAIKSIKELEKNFSDDSLFKETFGELLTKPGFSDDFYKELRNLRNETSFHFGCKVVKERLNTLELDDWVLFSTDSPKSVDSHFELSSEINIRFWARHAVTHEDRLETLGRLLAKISSMMKMLSGAIVDFMDGYIDELRVRYKDQIELKLE